jgi:hypothetical protein
MKIFEKIDRVYLTTAKATLLAAAIVTFLPILFRNSLRCFGRRRH